MKLLLSILVVFLISQQINCAIKADIVTGIEDQVGGYSKTWYSGYLDVETDSHTFKSHYWFFPAQDVEPEKAPVLLWLNGGPGCSSLLGAIQENGPFMFKPDTTEFYVNEYSWNKESNVIYLESPGGVGFSTIGDNNKWTDDQTAQANLQSLLKFFEGFSEFKKLPFYIAGESYAGIYIPTLSKAILDHNKQVSNSKQINLKGFLVGNGCTSPDQCNTQSLIDPYMYGMLATQGFFSPQQLESYSKYCGDFFAPEMSKINSLECFATYYSQTLPVQNDLNVYNVIGLCYHQSTESISHLGYTCNEQQKKFSFPTAKWYEDAKNTFIDFAANNPEFVKEFSGLGYQQVEEVVLQKEILQRRLLSSDGEGGNTIPPCADAIGAITFFNKNEIKKALHVDEDIEWAMCSDSIKYARSVKGTYDLYPELIKQGLRIVIFSGDTDAIVATQGTINWVTSFVAEQKFQTTDAWRAWYTDGYYETKNRQNAGQVWETEGISLVTFKGCGHQVPMDNPLAAQTFYNHFINDTPLPAY
ncbi:hypothetical protein PPERSA_00023 [Pseudocohnilembus persalinus]|uniref:Carboxypeptidase n=1 Tax=Pseudocohnilembus persalinus TaxID=266149 RepID=A0A0V0QV09_PSEPJ|nr:hypothetical protein PPERSA_00023 [Pseudocohnilembus persalinus]|eukprot:KRX06143.1 hypothetical protein PPERSA_00023 [Pseudocohnilembus persalinus]